MRGERTPLRKISIPVAAVVACALSAPIVSAQDKSAPAKPAMSMKVDQQMPQMQENMKRMQRQMEKLRATTDPKERQEHMQTLHENMKAMRGMSGPTMMGGQKGGAMMGNKKDGVTDGDMMKRHNMMENART